MAKDQKTKGPDPAATALTAPDAPVDTAVETAPDGAAASVVSPAGPPERPASGSRPRTPATTSAKPPATGRPATNPLLHPADAAVSAVSETARVVRTVLPNRLPAYLGGAALVVLGVVELPVAAGGALAYEALRRWRPDSRR